MRTLSRMAEAPKSDTINVVETAAMKAVRLRIIKGVPTYGGDPGRRFEDRMSIINAYVHGGDLKNDCRIVVNRDITARHDQDRNEYFRLAFEEVYGIPPRYAQNILDALDHHDPDVRKIAQGCRGFIDKYIYARDQETGIIKRGINSGHYRPVKGVKPPIDALTPENLLKRLDAPTFHFEAFTMDFARFCAKPDLTNQRAIDDLRRLRRRAFDEVQQHWHHKGESWDKITLQAKHQRTTGFWPQPQSSIAAYLEFNPPAD
ncbi:hypothetical protein QBC44DRAFT_334479 [Cladorrhinum sp. PSN332]|nr:hypothetical protein QBC44DRAFT_334479 [Cladorrhinum sp. PSN332]